MSLQRVLTIAALCGAKAAYDNFPVKSTNIAAAPGVASYMAASLESYNAFDAHAVHGASLADGGVVMAGKALKAEGSETKMAFCVKITGGEISWVWKSTETPSAANAVLQLPGGGDLLVVGYRSVGGVFKRSITKLSAATGAETWTATFDSDTASKHGAWEMAEVTTDGANILLAGLQEAASNEEFNFKSYGNVINGNAIVQSIPVTAVGATAPEASAATWSYKSAGYWTSKAARSLKDGSVVALMLAGEPGYTKMATLVKLTSAGAVEWGPTDFGGDGSDTAASGGHGEGTDVVVTVDQLSFLISGQGPGANAGTLSGRITSVSAAGTKAWTKSYSSIDYTQAGYPSLIKNECWGLQALSDGIIMGCGTGIEDCDGYSGQKLTDCESGNADSRTGAYARAKSIWQSMIVRTDLTGTVKWIRVDQYRPAEEPALGTAGWTALSSASEFVIVNSDGTYTSINDEGAGIGLLQLGGDGASGGSSSSGGSGGGADPCFPSSSKVTKANGDVITVDDLKEGDVIVAATADGKLATDTVSVLSLAKPAASAQFVTLSTANATLSLTEGHHIPFGEACCSMLKKAKDVVVGDKIWAVSSGAKSLTMQTVTSKASAVLKGLHSPVLTHGGFPIVDGVVTSFDDAQTVSLASYTLKYLLPLCKASGSCALFRRTFLNADRQYIDEA